MNDIDDGDDDDIKIYTYEDGYWIWDDEEDGLKFIRNHVPEPKLIVDDDPKGFIGFAKFNEDIDVYQQNKFDRKYRREIVNGKTAVVILQDVKDIVIYTAPLKIMNENIINLIHTSCYDRFIRSLIVYIQYYLQLYKVMQQRQDEKKIKLRSHASDIKELNWARNLSEMRIVVAKEYFHLIFVDKKHIKGETQLIGVESKFTETFLRISTQIVWISLKRHNFDLIDMEIGRIFRSQKFNLPLNKLKNKKQQLDIHTKYVLYGNYYHFENKKRINGSKRLRDTNKIKTISPLTQELLEFKRDHKILGINCIGFQSTDLRFSFMENLFCAPEEMFSNLNISLGILGKPRQMFDVLLKVIKKHGDRQGSNSKSTGPSSLTTEMTSPSTKSTKLLSSSLHLELMKIPPPDDKEEISMNLLPKYKETLPNDIQREKWIKWFKSKMK